MVSWSYPYMKLALNLADQSTMQRPTFLTCKQWGKTEDELYREHRSSIMNGGRSKELFDCMRGLTGDFLHEDDDPAKVILGFVQPGTYMAQYYHSVCYRVTHEAPYDPQ
jgi:hypothetical protein